MILLDTNIVVAHLNGDAKVTQRLTSQIDQAAVPALVVVELDYGAKASARAPENGQLDRTQEGGRVGLRRVGDALAPRVLLSVLW